jgi:hypothetical protein
MACSRRRSPLRSTRDRPKDPSRTGHGHGRSGIPLLHDHVSRALGTDMFEPEGDRLVALALLDIYSHKLLDEEAASAAEAGFDADED